MIPRYVFDMYLTMVCLVHSPSVIMFNQFESSQEWCIIDQDFRGEKYAKDKQVARRGNALSPPFVESLVRAHLPQSCVDKTQAA